MDTGSAAAICLVAPGPVLRPDAAAGAGPLTVREGRELTALPPWPWPASTIGRVGTLAPVSAIRGRTTEISVLGEALERAAAGRHAIVLIEGEAGIGKTRLLDAALENARGRGMQVAVGGAEELERTRPFGLVAGAFGCTRRSPDPRRAAITGLLATGGGGEHDPITVTSDPGLRFRAVDAFADLAEELALSGPLVIGVDDLQWADASSLLTLGVLSRRVAYLPVGLIACFRPSPHSPDLDRLAAALAAAGARHLVLGGLSEQAVTELVTEAVAAVPGPGLLAGLAGAAGNPLFVTELLAALAQEGVIETAGGRADVAEMTLPPTLRLTTLRRLSFLRGDTLQTLQAASILGSSFTVTDLSVTMARPALELSRTLAEGIRGRVLADDGDRLRFRHDLIRDAIYEDLPLSVRRGLHREAGQRLARTGAPSAQVAEHLARGAGSGDTEAIEWLARAAREAAATSPDVAADLMGRAVGLMTSADPGRDELVAERASSLMLAGRIADAEAACRLVLGRDHAPQVAGPLRVCLGQVLLAQGQVHDALGELERAAGSPVLSDADRPASRAWAAHARLWLGDLDGAAAVAEEARLAAVSAGDHLSISVALTTLARISEFRGHLRAALQIIDEAVRLADLSPGRLGHRYPVCMTRGHILIELDRLDEARSVLNTGRRISEELGVRWPLPTYQAFLAFERFIAGEWDDAIAELESSLELVEEIGETYSRGFAYGVLSLISLHRNDLSRAQESASAAARDLAGWSPGFRTSWAAWPHALILEAEGEPGRALAALADNWDRCTSAGLALEYPAVGADLIRLALTADDLARARDTSALVTELASGNDLPWMTGAALRCQGLVHDDAEILGEAADTYARGARPLGLALACEDAGTTFARQRQLDRGRPLIDQAIGIYERLGATRDLARAEATLRAAGIRRGRRGARGRPQIGWPSLTPTEHTITGLVAEGLSNPQIGERMYISRRTVQTHLAHVFAKLDISSRAQLAAEVIRQRT
jgi:DNA-binding CsgD family transcriptional regulator